MKDAARPDGRYAIQFGPELGLVVGPEYSYPDDVGVVWVHVRFADGTEEICRPANERMPHFAAEGQVIAAVLLMPPERVRKATPGEIVPPGFGEGQVRDPAELE